MPWAIMGDANIPAKDMQAAFGEGKSGAKVMTVGNTCFTKEGASAIDYGIVDRTLAPWLWYGSTCSTGLATHRPVQWCLKWQWNEIIEAAAVRTEAPLVRIPGPGRKGGPGHQGNLRAMQAAAADLVSRWGKERLAGNDPRRRLLARDLAIFHVRSGNSWPGKGCISYQVGIGREK